MQDQFLYAKVRTMPILWEAWRVIYKNGMKADASANTKKSVSNFIPNAPGNLKRIQTSLQKKKIKFDGSIGIEAKKSKGKDIRPLVASDVKTRIVQRAILEVLQSQSFIEPYLKVPTSFGAIKERGVFEAIDKVVEAIESGNNYYIKSDIASFFTKIPLPKVYEILRADINDEDFLELLENVTNLEIQNLDQIKQENKKYFEFDETGTPQGCCLSPLLGNILLHDFDRVTNNCGAVCIRYLDDFLILAPNAQSAWLAYNKGLKALKTHGLEAYNPKKDLHKAGEGKVTQGLDFLGFNIQGLKTRPSESNRQKLLSEIDKIIFNSLKGDFTKPTISAVNRELSLASALTKIGNKLEGWGKQYRHCTDKTIFEKLDQSISARLNKYIDSIQKRQQEMDTQGHFQEKRRLLGVFCLADINIPKKEHDK